MALDRGDLIRHFAVTTVDGSTFDYYETWQRRNLLLVLLSEPPLSDPTKRYVTEITDRRDDLAAFETTCVVTVEPILGIDAPAVLIADRWGEIYLSVHAATVSALPRATDIFECLRSVAHECPECQGEAR
jgi:hypothetical protein